MVTCEEKIDCCRPKSVKGFVEDLDLDNQSDKLNNNINPSHDDFEYGRAKIDSSIYWNSLPISAGSSHDEVEYEQA